MDKLYIEKSGATKRKFKEGKEDRTVHFPLCLAIKYGDTIPLECPDFLLNTSKGKLFIRTDSPFPADTELKLHFYIPPKIKLLAEFKGKVIGERRINNVCRNVIKISDLFHRKLNKLEAYLEEKNHLVDTKA